VILRHGEFLLLSERGSWGQPARRRNTCRASGFARGAWHAQRQRGAPTRWARCASLPWRRRAPWAGRALSHQPRPHVWLGHDARERCGG